MTGDDKKKRRPRGEGGVRWSEARQCFIAEKTVGYDGRGKRIVRTGSGKSETAAKRNLAKRVKEYEDGLTPESQHYRVKDAITDWLDHGQGDADDNTVKRYRSLCKNHVLPQLGGRKLADLRAPEVETWLEGRAEFLSASSLRITKWCLSRAVMRAMKYGLVNRNVVDLADMPRSDRPGRPSKSLTLEQSAEVLTLTHGRPMHCYIVVSILTGARTEELRDLRWSNVHLEADPPHVEVWFSVRRGRKTKTPKSKRTLALPELAVRRLREHKAAQAKIRLGAKQWEDNDLVFPTRTGRAQDPNTALREFRRALKAVPSLRPEDWTPREMRHSFVSILSASGVTVEEIADLVGHKGTRTTELVYRHQLKPVIQTGTSVMDSVFPAPKTEASGDA